MRIRTSQANKLLQAHQKKLRLLERKRRLLFPADVLPDPPPHDDFNPVSCLWLWSLIVQMLMSGVF